MTSYMMRKGEIVHISIQSCSRDVDNDANLEQFYKQHEAKKWTKIYPEPTAFHPPSFYAISDQN